MAGLCEVCSKEPSKYRCPTCELSSCSLTCTRSHKIYCAPKKSEKQQTPPPPPPPPEESQVPANTRLEQKEVVSSIEVQKLFVKYPGLRAKLREIYKTTLEEEWDAGSFGQNKHNTHRGERHNHHHHHHGNNRGTWTAEKGFNRGVGKVRKWREGCEGGECTDSDAEGFMKFMELVAGQRDG